MNIVVDLTYPIQDGIEVVFRSPADCSQITGLKVCYPGGSQEFSLADAHGNDVGNIDHLFAEDVVVKVILDVTTGMAFVQNADTNAYLEGRFEELQEAIDNLENSGGGGGGSATEVSTDQVIASDFVRENTYHDALDDILVENYSLAVDADAAISRHKRNADGDNPHRVTCEQIGAVTKEQHDEDILDAKVYAEDHAVAVEDFVVEYYYQKTEVDAMLAEPQYEHIQTVTTTEVQKNIIFDGLNLDEFALFAEIPADSTLAGTCSIVFNKDGKNVWQPYVSNAISASNVNHFAAYGRNERGLAFLEYTNATSSTSTAQKYVNRAPFFVEGNTPFTKVSISAGNNFPAGTKVELYGVQRTNAAVANITEG